MEHVTLLAQSESARLDQDRLTELAAQVGPDQAEEMVCRAIEELALRLGRAEELYRAGAHETLARHTHGMAAIADQIGMTALAMVARDVGICIAAADAVALAATLARLIRVGERSLSAVWDLQDFSD